MEASIKQGSTEALKLIEKADRLEAVQGLLHGSAYQPVRMAVRVFRRLAQVTTYPKVVETSAVRELAAELRRFSGTVSNPADGRMKDAALTLERLSQP